MDPHIFQSNEVDDQHQPPIEVILSFPLLLTDQIHHAVHESKVFKLECAYVGKQVHRLSKLLKFIMWFSDSNPLYERPVRRIYNHVVINLNRALILIRKCRHRDFIHRLISIIGAADFAKVFNLLDVSIGDMKWLLSIIDAGEQQSRVNGGIILYSPSIASNDMSLACVWTCIASLHTRSLNSKTESAKQLATLAFDSDQNKMMIVEEGGIAPLLKLLKHEYAPETQIAGSTALFNLANDQCMVRSVFNEHGVPVLAHAFRNSQISVQIEVAKVIARMAKYDNVSQVGFAKKNVIETIVMLLLNYEYNKRKPDRSKLIHKLVTNCCGALWMIARNNVANCRRITETKGLLCLAKLIEKEKDELQINCLMTVMEITSAAESNPDFRRSAFKNNSRAAKAIVDQLLRLIDQSTDDSIQIPAIRAIGQLARTFPASQTRVITPLIKQLSHKNLNVATESVIALVKFTCFENYLRVEHSKTIVDFEAIQPVMMLLTGNEMTQYHALVLLCYLSMHIRNDEKFQTARILIALENVGKSVACKYSELRDLVAQTVHHLKMLGIYT